MSAAAAAMASVDCDYYRWPVRGGQGRFDDTRGNNVGSFCFPIGGKLHITDAAGITPGGNTDGCVLRLNAFFYSIDAIKWSFLWNVAISLRQHWTYGKTFWNYFNVKFMQITKTENGHNFLLHLAACLNFLANANSTKVHHLSQRRNPENTG